MMTETRSGASPTRATRLLRALALMLEEEGARVRLRRPQAGYEQRDQASMLENRMGLLVWYCRGDQHRGRQVP